MESLLQYNEENDVVGRSVALSKKKREIAPNNSDDYDFAFYDSSTGCPSTSNNEKIIIIIIINEVFNFKENT